MPPIQPLGKPAPLLALVATAFGIYYTLADLVAVRGGTWFFDEKQITGVKLLGHIPNVKRNTNDICCTPGVM